MIPSFNIGFLQIRWQDVLDILLVTILLYQLYKLLRGSMALKIFIGFLTIYLFYLVTKALGMELISIILGQFMGVGVLAAIILFQPELRKFLLLIGKSTVFNRKTFLGGGSWRSGTANKMDITPFVEAAKSLSAKFTGALIVFARGSELKFYAESGDKLDAEISKRLLLSIFNKTSPLHDGAVIISAGRIKAARCILPVSENDELPASLGLRHRAAIGITELTDAVVLVVSEETGQISVVRNGQIYRNLTPALLRERLSLFLIDENSPRRSAPEEVETTTTF